MSPRLPAAPGRRGSQSVLASEDDCGEGGEGEERVPSRRSQACRDPPTSLLCDCGKTDIYSSKPPFSLCKMRLIIVLILSTGPNTKYLKNVRHYYS